MAAHSVVAVFPYHCYTAPHAVRTARLLDQLMDSCGRLLLQLLAVFILVERRSGGWLASQSGWKTAEKEQLSTRSSTAILLFLHTNHHSPAARRS